MCRNIERFSLYNQNHPTAAVKLLLAATIQWLLYFIFSPIHLMKSSFFAAPLAVLLVMAAELPAAQAQALRPATNQPVERARIRQGVSSGELTRPEAARLRAREANITATKQAARADGVVTPTERRVVRGEERRTSRAIYRQKHDGQVR